MSDEDSLLTNLCAICHIQPPKYRCPRCSTRTCSLPCTKRHKHWSQCSGIRDPGAYLRRSELGTESAFDRDFNFISGIERRIERAGREAENRGVDVEKRGISDLGVVGLDGQEQEDGGERRRKRPHHGQGQGPGPDRSLARGEAGFLRRANEAGVRVIKAPKGMSRAKMNSSKWHPKQKCLQWTIEWVAGDTTKRVNCAETLALSEAYDRAFPLSREEKEARGRESTSVPALENESEDVTQLESNESLPESAQQTQGPAIQSTENQTEDSTSDPSPQSTPAAAAPPTEQDQAPSSTSPSTSTPPTNPSTKPHRNTYFYLHRPRTATKKLVVSPLDPSKPLTEILRNRTVLEFPTIYILQHPLDDQSASGAEADAESRFILEKEYLRTHQDETQTQEASEDVDAQPAFGEADIPEVDEGKMLEVLEKDLLGAAPS